MHQIPASAQSERPRRAGEDRYGSCDSGGLLRTAKGADPMIQTTKKPFVEPTITEQGSMVDVTLVSGGGPLGGLL